MKKRKDLFLSIYILGFVVLFNFIPLAGEAGVVSLWNTSAWPLCFVLNAGMALGLYRTIKGAIKGW